MKVAEYLWVRSGFALEALWHSFMMLRATKKFAVVCGIMQGQ